MYNFLLDKRHNVPYNSITQMKKIYIGGTKYVL